MSKKTNAKTNAKTAAKSAPKGGKTPAVGDDAALLGAFAQWLTPKAGLTAWSVETMGNKPTAAHLRLALATGAKPASGAAMVRAMLFRPAPDNGATKKQRDAVMSMVGRGSCENQGAFGDNRRSQWPDGQDNVTPGQWRNVQAGTAVIALTTHGRSHWQAKLVTAWTGREAKPSNSAAKAASKAAPKGKAPAPAKGKAPASKAPKAPSKAKGKAPAPALAKAA
jgi:hypothetical protein